MHQKYFIQHTATEIAFLHFNEVNKMWVIHVRNLSHRKLYIFCMIFSVKIFTNINFTRKNKICTRMQNGRRLQTAEKYGTHASTRVCCDMSCQCVVTGYFVRVLETLRGRCAVRTSLPHD